MVVLGSSDSGSGCRKCAEYWIYDLCPLLCCQPYVYHVKWGWQTRDWLDQRLHDIYLTAASIHEQC